MKLKRSLMLVLGAGALVAVAALPACRTTWDTPFGPITTEPMPRTPGTTVPNPGSPNTPVPNPSSPGRTVEGYDTDGDGLIDLIYDPITKKWYTVTPKIPAKPHPGVKPGASMPAGQRPGGTPVNVDQLGLPQGPGLGVEVPELSGRPLQDVKALLNWEGFTAEEWLASIGLDARAGTPITSPLLFKHEFETDEGGLADVTVFWSSAFGVPRVDKHDLDYAIFALPSKNPGKPAAMQLRLRGDWTAVGAFLLDMGIQEIEHVENGINWGITGGEVGGTTVDVSANGVHFATYTVR